MAEAAVIGIGAVLLLAVINLITWIAKGSPSFEPGKTPFCEAITQPQGD